MRALTWTLIYLLAVSTSEASGAYLSAKPPIDTFGEIVVPADGTVIFQLHGNQRHLACTGIFTNAMGKSKRTFTSSIKVKFGRVAQGALNPCSITMTTLGKQEGQNPTTKTVTVYVVLVNITSSTLHHAPDGTSDNRSVVAVGEKMMLTIQPKEALMDSEVTWHIDKHAGSLSHRTGLATILASGMIPGAYEFRADVNSLKPVVIAFDDGLLKQLGKKGAGKRHEKSDHLFSIPDPSQARLAEYTTKLEKIDRALATHKTL